jgi:oligopeptide transport system ATP-binding protein
MANIIPDKPPALYVNSLNVMAGKKKLLTDVSFELYSNDVLGLIGETGSGKTVLIDALGMNSAAGLTTATKELRYRVDESDIQLMNMTEEELSQLIWGKKLTFILSNARNRFNPIMTVGEQFCDIIKSNLNLSDEQAVDKAKKMFALVQMPDPKQNMNNYPHELSGGMIQRVEIAIALSMSPKFLLADEPTMGLDVTVQRQILDLMNGLFTKMNSCVVLATRDLGIAANYCNKIAVLYRGKIVEFMNVHDFFKTPRHPYSKYLLDIAFVSNDKNPERKKRMFPTDTEASSKGCFYFRSCERADSECNWKQPEQKRFDDGSFVRCCKY